MRRFISISMAILFLATMITGFLEPHLNPGDAGHHTVISLLFVGAMLIHVAINFKAFARYLTGPTKKLENQ